MPNLIEDVRRGARRGMARNIGSLANLVDLARKGGEALAKSTGLPEGGGLTGPLSDYLRKKQAEYEPGDPAAGQGLVGRVAEGVGQGLAELPRFLGAGRLLGPVAGAGAAAGAAELHRGPKEAAKEAGLAAAGAKIIQTFSKMPAVFRGAAEGAVDATQAAVAGGSPQDIASAVVTGRVLSSAGERGPSAVKPSPKFGEAGAAAGKATRDFAMDTSGELRLAPATPESPRKTRRAFVPNEVGDLTQELQAGDYVMLTATQEAIGPWDHPANIGANKALESDLASAGFNAVEIPDSFSAGVRQGRSFHVPGMTPQEGAGLAKKFGQQEIIVGRNGVAGMLNVENGNWTPVLPEETKIGPAAAQEPFFSVIKIGEELVPFSMKPDPVNTRPFNAAELGGPIKEVSEKAPQRNPNIEKAAQEYVKAQGLPELKFAAGYHKQPEKVLADIADTYAAAVHDPDDPAVLKSYQDFSVENAAQWKFATEQMGISFEPWAGEGQPYNNSAEMIGDVVKNKHMFFFTGGDLPANHPLAGPSGVGNPANPLQQLTHNDVFRAVHDLFGHAKAGFQFGPRGEYNAFLSHYQMYGPVARSIALVNETLAQNAWVNYGQHIRESAQPVPVADRPFAEQKAARLPAEGVEAALRPIAGLAEGPLPATEIARMPRPLAKEAAAYRDPELMPDAAEPTVPEVARRLQDLTKELYGEDLPTDMGGRTNALVRLMRQEIPEQLALTPDAPQWYSASISEMMNNVKAVEPALGAPAQEGIFKAVLAVLSNGTPPDINLKHALAAYREYHESGAIPLTQADGSKWSARSNEPGLTKLNDLISELGEQGAMDFLISKQSREELLKRGNRDTIRKGVIFDEADQAHGAYVLGPKLGAFFLNMNGIHEITVDRWMWRTSGRAWGDIARLNKQGEWQMFEPQGLSARVAFANAVKRVAKDFGLDPEAIQALQWYAEKGLYQKHGAGEEAMDFGAESRKLRATEEQKKTGVRHPSIKKGARERANEAFGDDAVAVIDKLRGAGPEESGRLSHLLEKLIKGN